MTELLVYLFFFIFNRVLQRFKTSLCVRTIDQTRYKHYTLSIVRHSALWRRLVIRNVMSVAARKFTKTPILGSRSFKVTDVGTTGKLVGSACYDKQQVCVYLQPFLR